MPNSLETWRYLIYSSQTIALSSESRVKKWIYNVAGGCLTNTYGESDCDFERYFLPGIPEIMVTLATDNLKQQISHPKNVL